MRRAGRFLGRLLLGLGGLALALWLFAPEEPVDRVISFDEASLPADAADLPGWLAGREARFADIRPGEEKRIVWAGAPGAKTPLAVIYIHGFSASSEEIRPVPDDVAAALGANLFFTRLAGHGRSGPAMAEPVAGDWIEDMAEAIAIGRRLGERVLVIATSTGGTLAAIAATDPVLSRDMAGIVMISPNFGVRRLEGRLLDLPFLRFWGPWVTGPELGFEPANEGQARHWTTRYPTLAVMPMSGLVAHARGLDYHAVQVPLLVLLSPEDQVVDPARTRALVAGWGGPVRLEERHMGPGDDNYSHVLAGDILSPGQTDAVVGLILGWAEGL